MQNNTSKLNTFLLTVLIIIAGLVLWKMYAKDEKVAYTPTPMPEVVDHNVNQNQNNTNNTPTPSNPTSSFNWNASMAEITAVIKKDFDSGANSTQPVAIVRSNFDITGDGVNEALVFNGNSGAYVTEVAVLRVENGKIVSAQWKTKNGQVGLVSLAGGASVMNKLDYGTVENRQAFYQTRVMMDSNTGQVATCELDAYKWNKQTKLFEYSASLSSELLPGYCSSAGPQA